jgi:hypothetical protein
VERKCRYVKGYVKVEDSLDMLLALVPHPPTGTSGPYAVWECTRTDTYVWVNSRCYNWHTGVPDIEPRCLCLEEDGE